MSRNVGMVLTAVVLVAIVALSWFFLLSPIRDDIQTADQGIQTARVELLEEQTKLAQAEATRESGRRNQARLLALAKMVPSGVEIPSLLVQIQDLAAQTGIDWMSVQPGEPLQAQDVRVIPLSLEFKGSFYDVSEFIYQAEKMVAHPGRLLAINSLKLGVEGESDSSDEESPAPELRGSPLLKTEMVIYAFDSSIDALDVPTAPPPTDDGDESSDDGPGPM